MKNSNFIFVGLYGIGAVIIGLLIWVILLLKNNCNDQEYAQQPVNVHYHEENCTDSLVLIVDEEDIIRKNGKLQIPVHLRPLDQVCTEDSTKQYLVMQPTDPCNADTIIVSIPPYKRPKPVVKETSKPVQKDELKKIEKIEEIQKPLVTETAPIIDSLDVLITETRTTEKDTVKRDLYKGTFTLTHSFNTSVPVGFAPATTQTYQSYNTVPNLNTRMVQNDPAYSSVMSVKNDLPRQMNWTYTYKTVEIDETKQTWGKIFYWAGQAAQAGGIIWNRVNMQQDPATLIYEDGKAPLDPNNSYYSRNVSESKREQAMQRHDNGSSILWGAGKALEYVGYVKMNNAISVGVTSVNITIPIR